VSDVEDESFLNIQSDELLTEIRDNVEDNLLHLPPFYNPYVEPFLSNGNLFALYAESYRCIVYGLYHAGILLMGQLMELTVFGIIRLHTGKHYNGNFASALKFAAGRIENAPQPYLIHPEIVDRIIALKNSIRNPYTHGDTKKILEGQTATAVMFKIGNEHENILRNHEKAVDLFKSGTISYSELNPADEPSIAYVFKRDVDKKRCFELAWELYPLFNLLLDQYLNREIHREYVDKHGSLYAQMPVVDVTSDDKEFFSLLGRVRHFCPDVLFRPTHRKIRERPPRYLGRSCEEPGRMTK